MEEEGREELAWNCEGEERKEEGEKGIKKREKGEGGWRRKEEWKKKEKGFNLIYIWILVDFDF